MKRVLASLALIVATGCSLLPTESLAQQQTAQVWLTLPAPAALPAPTSSGTAHVNGIDLNYAIYGDGPPILFLHGGLGNIEDWGNQVPAFRDKYRVFLVDSRGHGRSTRNAQAFTFDLMAADVVALMDHLHIKKTSIVGWSDGGIIALNLAMNYSERVDRVFAFGANFDPSGLAPGIGQSAIIARSIEEAGAAYRRLSPAPDEYEAFVAQIGEMWANEPNWTSADLARIHTRVAIAAGDHEEAILRAHTEQLARQIRSAQLIILRDVSHFAPLQDPAQFNSAIRRFLDAP